MRSGAEGGGDLDRTPQLAPECDPSSLDLTPAEGYLLSRIDGHTPWRLLREIGGLPADAVDECIERWLGSGLVVLPELRPAAAPKSSAKPAAASPSKRAARPEENPGASSGTVAASGAPPSITAPAIDESLLDEGLDLDVAIQRRVLEFESRLGADYFSILDVGRDADARKVKRAYFKLSKEFHPDRYFRREIGPYVQRLEGIFKKIMEAYELLSDPIARAEVEKSMLAGPVSVPAPEQTGPGSAAAPQPRKLTPIERLRQRMPFRIPEHVIAERREKADEFFRQARRSDRVGNHLEAASSIRLAIAFDPYNREYKSIFADIQSRSAEARASQLLEKSGQDSYGSDDAQRKEALCLLEEVLLYRPHDPEINIRAARVAIDLEQLETASEYVERALEHSPDVAEYHVVRSDVFRAEGNRGHAIKELEAALDLDSECPEVREKLAKLRGGRRMAKGGMR